MKATFLIGVNHLYQRPDQHRSQAHGAVGLIILNDMGLSMNWLDIMWALSSIFLQYFFWAKLIFTFWWIALSIKCPQDGSLSALLGLWLRKLVHFKRKINLNQKIYSWDAFLGYAPSNIYHLLWASLILAYGQRVWCSSLKLISSHTIKLEHAPIYSMRYIYI